MRVVIDCNILVMCLTSRSPYHIIYRSLIEGKFILVISSDILYEYEEIIQQKYGHSTAAALIALMLELSNVHNIVPFYKWQLITTDPDDNKYVDVGIAGKADFLVTEDRHFNILNNISFPKLQLLDIESFVNKLK